MSATVGRMTDTPRRPGRPATGRTPARSIRIPDDVWQAAKDAAEARGETVTDAVVRFLRRYGKA